jgi:hypothetical protein
MRWMPVVIVALCCVSAAQALAESGVGAVATATQTLAARTGKIALPRDARLAAMQLEFGGAVAAVQPPSRGRVAGEMPAIWLLGEEARLAPAGAARSRVAHRPGDSGAGTTFIYSVSDRVSLGLRYRFLTSEDLTRFEVAESGALRSGYTNHRFVVRASWQF